MDLEKSSVPARGEGCLVVALRMPVRIVVLVLVVPVRMVWDALVVVGRFLGDTVFRPLGRALLWLGRGVAWLGKVLVVVPAVALYRYVLAPLGWYLVVVPSVWVYRWILTPLGHAAVWCGKGLYWIVRVLLVLPALVVWRWVLAPVGRVLAVVAREVGAAFGHAWRIAGHISLVVGRFLAALLRWAFVEPARWVYRSVLTPVGHAVRDAVLRPAAEAARRVGRATRQALAPVRMTVRQARAEVRRALLGEPKSPRSGGDRELARGVGRGK
ncbi:hypothetical protein ACIF9R_18370 [Streptomyces sp. NPDC086080]|uniref:hypothetical protein n=1 Tax=Streptomyces sp. NPDC086080 TaxID=3365748 RepID=UPI0037CF9A12